MKNQVINQESTAYSSSHRRTGTRAWGMQVALACRWMDHPQQRARKYLKYLVGALYVPHFPLSILVRTGTVVSLFYPFHFKFLPGH